MLLQQLPSRSESANTAASDSDVAFIDLLVPCSPPRQFIDAVSLLVGHMLQCFSFALRVDVISFVRSLVDAGPVSFHT